MKTTDKKEWLFWILQVAGWFFASSLVFLSAETSATYKLHQFFSGATVGIIATSIYRYYLKNNVDTEVFGRASIIRLLFAFISCSALLYFLESLSENLYKSIWTSTESELAYYKMSNGFYTVILDVMVTLFTWTIIYFVLKFILEANRNNLRSLELNATLRETQLNALKGQVNPHFMFNSLNNIRGLMLEDVEKSREMITKLSEMLEYAVEKNTVDVIPLSEELEMVENYIALSKIQMEERLQFVATIDQESLDLSIPPMIVQLLVENAAKHGISNLKQGGTITLTVNKNNNELTLIVANTGKLRIANDSTQLGLKNIRQRLRLMYGDKASFSLAEIEEEVVATIKIPLL